MEQICIVAVHGRLADVVNRVIFDLTLLSVQVPNVHLLSRLDNHVILAYRNMVYLSVSFYNGLRDELVGVNRSLLARERVAGPLFKQVSEVIVLLLVQRERFL